MKHIILMIFSRQKAIRPAVNRLPVSWHYC